jgi:hypothetical protein
MPFDDDEYAPLQCRAQSSRPYWGLKTPPESDDDDSDRELSPAELREAIAEGLYYAWSKEVLEAGKRRLAGDTARAATSAEVKAPRQEARALKEVVAEQTLELRLLKKI